MNREENTYSRSLAVSRTGTIGRVALHARPIMLGRDTFIIIPPRATLNPDAGKDEPKKEKQK